MQATINYECGDKIVKINDFCGIEYFERMLNFYDKKELLIKDENIRKIHLLTIKTILFANQLNANYKKQYMINK